MKAFKYVWVPMVHSNRWFVPLFAFTVLFAALFSLLPCAVAQGVSGRMAGTVTDNSGAVIAGAAVQARNIETNAVTNATSQEDGTFSFPSLTAGAYEVTTTMNGFESSKTTGVRVEVQNTATLRVEMKVGSASSVVQVTSTATSVNTEDASVQTTIGSRTLESLPVAPPSGSAQRSVINTVQQIQPGAAAVSGSQSAGQYSFNGGRTSNNNYKLDGSDVNDYFNANNDENPAFPSQENLGEVSVITQAIDAKYGNSGGAQITATIKSGTNGFHGIGWGYFQNQAWNANSWTAKHFSQPRAPGSQNWIGGNIGGPVWLPHIYDGRDKTFFFFSYERTTPTAFNTATFLVPSAAERTGTFSTTEVGALKPGFSPVVDPATFSPLAKAVLAANLLPLPNAQGQLFSWNWSRSQTTNNYIIKIDQQFGSKNHLSGAFVHLFQDPISNNYGSCCGGAFTDIPPGLSTVRNPHHIYSLFFQDVYSITPNLLNTIAVGGGHTLVTVGKGAQNPNYSWSKLGVPGVTPDTGTTELDAQIPVNIFSSGGFLLWGGYIDSRTGDTTNISDEVNWVHGRNTIQVGYEQRIRHDTKQGTYDAAGELDYANYQGGSSGNAFYDFFTDTGAVFNQSATQNFAHSYPQHTMYLQDRIKLNPRLTATLGARWDPNEGYREDNNRFSVYHPGQQSIVYPNAPVGQIFYGDRGVDRPGYSSTWTNVNPRIGLAYDVTGTGKLAIHAGFGAFSDFTTLQNIADNVGYPYQASYTTGDDPNYYKVGKDPYRGHNPFPFSSPAPGSAAAQNYVFPTLQSISSWRPGFNSAHIYQWNLSTQWEPANSYVITVGYIGSRSTKLLGIRDLNTPVFIAGKTTPSNGQSRRPDQLFQAITENYNGVGSTYSAVQVILNKRFSNGLSVLANYAFGRTLGECAGGGILNEGGINGCRDIRNPSIDYGPEPQDIKHISSVVWNYAVPYHSTRYLTNLVLGGWSWGGILHAQSGDPLTVGSNSELNGGSAGAHGNYIGGRKYASFKRTDPFLSYVNPAAFCGAENLVTAGVCNASAQVAVGSSPIYGNTSVGFLRGPGRLNFDMTAVKTIPVTDRLGGLELRASAFNVFNHTQLNDPGLNTSAIGAASPSFGVINSAAGPRTLQGSVRYRF